MVGFADNNLRAEEETKYIHDYCTLTRKPGELLAVCDEAGRLHAVTSGRGIVDMDPLRNHIDDIAVGLEPILQKANGSIVKTQISPGGKLISILHSQDLAEPESAQATIYPMFQSKTHCELYSIAIPCIPQTSSSHPSEKPAGNTPYCIVDTRTGIFLEANEDFRKTLSIGNIDLMRSRCAEIDMQDLLLLATLNADRRCFFQAQARPDTPKGWYLSETVSYGDRECLRIWFPNDVTFPESQLVSSELAKAFCSNWQEKPKQVLICDDNELLIDTCISIMEWADIPCKIAANGKEALQLLEIGKFDCILLDLNMPKLNGFDTARLIRKSKRVYRDIPIIAMTATPLSRVDLASQLKHFDAILQKPFDIEDIKNSVDEARNNLRVKQDFIQNNPDIAGNTDHAHSAKLNDYEPTSFMIQFSSRTDILEDLRNRMLNNLQSTLELIKTLDPREDQPQMHQVVQQAQSMAMSVGAWKLATHAALTLEKIDKTGVAQLFEAKDTLINCIEEAQCFYNTVDWNRFLEPFGTEAYSSQSQEAFFA